MPGFDTEVEAGPTAPQPRERLKPFGGSDGPHPLPYRGEDRLPSP